VGRDAVLGLRDIRHSGIQMACYDAVGKALGVPAHALMGRQVRPRVPYAYWTIDLPPEVFAAQAQKAVDRGYRVYKYKCRPWWDPVEQIERAAKVVPEGFEFWLDFNGHLREVRQAVPILKKLAEFDCVGGFESPIPQRDAAGYKELRRKIDRPIAAHYGSGCCHVRSDPGYDRGTPANTQIAEKLCDGFVLGGFDVETLRQHAAVAAEARIPFWIQVVGTGLRAAWVAHLASTCQQGLLSHLAAQNVWQQDIVAAPDVQAGWVSVPEGYGLGVAVHGDVIEQVRTAPATPSRRRISTVVYPDGQRWHFATEQQRHEAYYFGDLPGFVRGIRLEIRDDDYSRDFANLYERCLIAPVGEGE
jgi:L-alanine-DL-glutamate epimerase-like enolase superfamily enzyme